MLKKTWAKWLLIVIVGLGIAFLPVPQVEGLSPDAWKLLGVFVATILTFILQPIEMGPAALLSISVLIVFKVAKLSEVLVGFSSSVTWLVAMAFFLARGFSKTGLGRRLSLLIVKAIGSSSLKLGYAVAFSDMVFGPAIPSFTSRSGGLIFPVINGLCDVYDSHPGPTARKVGAYLMQLEHQACCIVAAMFLTGSAINPLAVELVSKNVGMEITWTSWALACAIPGFACLMILPIFLYTIFPPSVKKTPEAPQMAREELAKMGPMSVHEKIQLGVFIGCLVLWATSAWTGLDATAVAILAVCVLLFTRTITWKDCLSEGGAWDTIVWIGVLITLSGMLTKFGIITWFAGVVGPMVSGFNWIATFLILAALYLYTHYFFASVTSHITSLFAPLLALMITVGAPPAIAVYTMCGFSTLCGALTHYSSGHSPIFFAAGYVDQPTWWKTGFMCSVVNYIVFIGVGVVWWKLLGLY